MLTYLKRLTDERDSLTESATSLATRAAEEERDLSDTERQSMASWQQRCAEIDTQLTEYNTQLESQRAYANLRAQLDEDRTETRSVSPSSSTSIETRSWGDLFVESDAFSNYNGAGSSARVEVPGLFEQRAAITSALPAPWVTPPYVYSPASYNESTPLLDVIGHVTTSSNAVEWIQWGPNPMGAATVVPEGELKPEATITPVAHADSLDTYAHWKGITRQALEDIPQIRSIVESRLRAGLYRALENAAVAALAADTTIPDVTDPDLLTGLRIGMGTVQANGYGQPNAVLLNPADWAALDVSVAVMSNSAATSQAGFWGLRPIALPDIPRGTAYVGDFSTAVQMFDKGSASVFMSDSHADNFVRNILLVLAEMRALVTIPDPFAAAKVIVGTPVGASQQSTKAS